MKFNPYPFIGKANQVLFFFGAIALLAIVAVEILKEVWPRSYPPQQVKIIDKNSGRENGPVVEYIKDYKAKIKETHIIELRSNTVDAASKHVGDWEGRADMFQSNYRYSDIGDDTDVINVLFVDDNDNRRVLFESDCLITSIRYATFDDESLALNKNSKNIYSVVSEDTNNNDYLDGSDSRDLYVSEYNGYDNEVVVEDIYSYQMIDNDLILIERKDKKDHLFFEYDISNGNLVKLNTGIELQ